MIARGEVEVVLNHNSPQESIVNHLGKGQYFGEIGLIEGGKRTATVRVSPDAEAVVMQLDRQTFNQL
ncbi:MAG: cyclic nucleotide-binding domain-containing protein [Cytophagales bacterium]|nr:cyclic nucleotide-binding domain-containing protein [Cytophagales bacterium]